MIDNEIVFLMLPWLPLRVSARQAGWLLNCTEETIAGLVTAGELRPLGKPRPGAVKWFSTAQILQKANDEAWLGRITNVPYAKWLAKNNARRNRPLKCRQLPPL